ncbi:MAG: hypothetical protein ACREOU_01930 [Candidatus Eiseniibacteriota bacterium]
MKRILLAGLLGGLVVFGWSAISHMVLPLGEAGIRTIPDEPAMMNALRTHVPGPGLYFFPGYDQKVERTKEQEEAAMKDWSDRYRLGPTGILVIAPANRQPMSPSQFVVELVTNILAAAIAAMLLFLAAAAIPKYSVRVLFVTMLGVFAFIVIDLSHWNWYGFPDTYTCAALIDQTVGWFLGGLVIARIIRPPV